MTYQDQDKFREAFNVRRCEKCCGNCKHFERIDDCSGCKHPKQSEFDSVYKMKRESDPEYPPETYGAIGGTYVDEGEVCNLWEAGGEVR